MCWWDHKYVHHVALQLVKTVSKSGKPKTTNVLVDVMTSHTEKLLNSWPTGSIRLLSNVRIEIEGVKRCYLIETLSSINLSVLMGWQLVNTQAAELRWHEKMRLITKMNAHIILSSAQAVQPPTFEVRKTSTTVYKQWQTRWHEWKKHYKSCVRRKKLLSKQQASLADSLMCMTTKSMCLHMTIKSKHTLLMWITLKLATHQPCYSESKWPTQV